MKLNHIIDRLLDETNIDIKTNEENIADYDYIKNLITKSTKHIIGKNLDTNKEIKVLDEEIIYFETYNRDIYFTTIDNQLLVIKVSMKKLEEILNDRNYFVKISKNTIVNINHIQELSYHSNMRIQVLLSSGYKQIVNRSYLKDFKRCIEEVYN